MNLLVITNPADYHMHARGVNGTPEEVEKFTEASFAQQRKLEKANDILEGVSRLQVGFSRILTMPNLLPSHLRNAEEVLRYRNSLDEEIPEDHHVGKILTISLKPETTPEMIEECAKIPEFKAVKYYPGGVTTNSGGSSGDIDPENPQVKAVFKKMAQLGIILSLHPETTEKKNIFGHITGGFVHSAEREFQTIAEKIAENHPDLNIVIEHISTAEMANLVGSGRYQNIYGTVTPQHLLYTAHDKEGGHAFDPHLHCKPTLKNPEDLLAIQRLVLSGNKKVFFGSDSAPHPQDVKECAHCASGVFSSPIAIQAVTSWFMESKTHDWWEGETGEDLHADVLRSRLESFMGTNGETIYGKSNVDKYVTLEKKGFRIPESYPTFDSEVKLVPMNAGKSLPWSISGIQVRTQGAIKNLEITPLGQIFHN